MSSPDTTQIVLHSKEGRAAGTLPVSQTFGGPVNAAVLWQAVRMYLANQRQGTADTKTRGEVRGGGKKPWRQKHTGRARAGSIRSPLWRKGGIVFGPHPREYRYELPKALRVKALVESLKVRVQAGDLLAVEGLEGGTPKTAQIRELLNKMQLTTKTLVVTDGPDPALARITRNLPDVTVKSVANLNCYDVLRHDKLVVFAGVLARLEGLLVGEVTG